MPHDEALSAADTVDAAAPEAVLVDIAVLALVIADQIAFASSETERWALGFLDGMADIEQHVRRLRRCCPCTSSRDLPAPPPHRPAQGPVATLSGLDAIEAVARRTQTIAQHQDIVRQQLESLSGALSALHGQCLRLSVSAGWPESAAVGSGIAEIMHRLRLNYVVAGQDTVHQQSLARTSAAGAPSGG
jgi:hypothetical protein